VGRFSSIGHFPGGASSALEARIAALETDPVFSGTVRAERLIATTAGSSGAPAVAIEVGANVVGLIQESGPRLGLAAGGIRTGRFGSADATIVNAPLSVSTHYTIRTSTTSAELSATTNDLNPGNAGALLLTTSGGAQILTSISGGTEGRDLIVMNLNAIGGDNITLQAEAGLGGTAANRLALPADLVLAPRAAVALRYTSSRWIALTT